MVLKNRKSSSHGENSSGQVLDMDCGMAVSQDKDRVRRVGRKEVKSEDGKETEDKS